MRKTAVFFLALILAGCMTHGPADHKTVTQSAPATPANLDEHTLQALLDNRAQTRTVSLGEQNRLISSTFLGTPYAANRLQGSASTPEKLVIDFTGLDCFTYLDYVEALRKSSTRTDFINNLVQTRYVNGQVDYLHRRHFFSDWAHTERKLADDVTAQVSPQAVTVIKQLNRKADGSTYLPGLPVVERSITYIPASAVDENLISHLQTGDYIGIYTPLAGLDVTHTGFFIMTEQGPVLRNASSTPANQKVVDAPFMAYVAKTPGIVVLRAVQAGPVG